MCFSAFTGVMRDYTAYGSLLQHSLSQVPQKQSFGAPQLKKARENIIASTYARFGVQLLLHPGIFKSLGGKLGNYKSMCIWRLLPHFSFFFLIISSLL